MFTTVLFDVDGTLVDSNDAHAEAWVKAFAEAGLDIEVHRIRRLIGKGGDKLMPEVSGIAEDSPQGKPIAERRKAIFKAECLPHLRPFAGAAELVAALKERDFTVVAASSAKKAELQPLLQVAGADWLMDALTSSDDAEESKPDPDIIQAALARVRAQPSEAVMIGDTPYDIEAAGRAGVQTIAFRCGGWDDESLAGAIAIYDGPWELVARLEASPLARRAA